MTDKIQTPFIELPDRDTAIEVAPGVLWLRLPLPMALDHVNIYAFDEGDSWTIIDTGFDTKTTRKIWEGLLAGPLGGKPVGHVIVTHYHPDHIGLAGWFMSRGATLTTTRTSYLNGRMLQLDFQEVPSAEAITFYERAGMEPDELARRKVEQPFNFANCVHAIPQG